MWYIYTMKYYSAIKKEWNNATCSNMDGPGDYHTKWSNPDRERQISYDIAYMWNLKKMIQMNLFTIRNRFTGIENNLWLPKGKGGGAIN